ncbi:glycosyltransferase [Paenibacillaceae bacterium WGS1546]|uniref:glycosyltransferase n=1 Tax=Cohnella sp. WGS1546 TaxID=3366810 RepID=UPI00372CF29C
MDKLISLCMIVKDEESHLDRCLSSVKDYVDEMIIVDTGSTDNTKQIASIYTDHVYDFTWINDFAAARNESLKYATGQWILVMDADEYFTEADAKALRNFLKQMKPVQHTIYGVSVISFLGSQKKPVSNESIVDRIFPNYMGIKYERPIHEQPVSKNKALMRSLNLPIRIYHSGYTEETLTSKNKHERNLEIFFKMKSEKGYYSAYDHLKIGSQYVMMKRHEEGMDHLQQALKRNPKELGSAYKHLLFAILQVYLETEKYIEGWDFCDQYLKEYDNYPDILSLRGMILLNLGFKESAKSYLTQAYQQSERRAIEEKTIFIVSPELAISTPIRLLAHLNETERNFEQAVYFLTKLVQLNPRDIVPLTKLIEILCLKEKSSVILSFLHKLLDFDNHPIHIFMAYKIALSLGNVELANALNEKLATSEDIGSADHLRHAVIINDRASFDRIVEQCRHRDAQDSAVITHLYAGTLIWREPKYALMVVADDEQGNRPAANELILSMLDDPIPLDDSPFAYTLLSELYTLNQHTAFDFVMDHVSSPALINRLANFFYDRYNEDLAFQYYNHLETLGELNAASCANIAESFYREGRTKEALMFMERAMLQQPDHRLYKVRACLFGFGTSSEQRLFEKLLEQEPAISNSSLTSLFKQLNPSLT